jgi:hypothetical protein
MQVLPISYLQMETGLAFKVLFKTVKLFSEHSALYMLLLVSFLAYSLIPKLRQYVLPKYEADSQKTLHFYISSKPNFTLCIQTILTQLKL